MTGRAAQTSCGTVYLQRIVTGMWSAAQTSCGSPHEYYYTMHYTGHGPHNRAATLVLHLQCFVTGHTIKLRHFNARLPGFDGSLRPGRLFRPRVRRALLKATRLSICSPQVPDSFYQKVNKPFVEIGTLTKFLVPSFKRTLPSVAQPPL